jgi:hypothetical protein
MTRETIVAKSARYLAEGRLTVTGVFATDWDRAHIEARCKGGGEVYRLGYDWRRGWFCSCPSRGRCCHLTALKLVVVGRPVPVACRGCGERTDEWYMVHDGVWAAAGMDPDGGRLCIGCLEDRLGRELTADAFTDAPVNDPAIAGPRLRRRLTSPPARTPA